jgi:hypothetical protein
MSSVKTRRQASAATTPATPTPKRGPVLTSMNGNGSAHSHVREAEPYPRENIFIFIPNLIGMLAPPNIVQTSWS